MPSFVWNELESMDGCSGWDGWLGIAVWRMLCRHGCLPLEVDLVEGDCLDCIAAEFVVSQEDGEAVSPLLKVFSLV